MNVIQQRNRNVTAAEQEQGSGRRRYQHDASGEISPWVKDSEELTKWFRCAEARIEAEETEQSCQ